MKSKAFIQNLAVFAGYSLGEYSALASVADDFPSHPSPMLSFTVGSQCNGPLNEILQIVAMMPCVRPIWVGSPSCSPMLLFEKFWMIFLVVKLSSWNWKFQRQGECLVDHYYTNEIAHVRLIGSIVLAHFISLQSDVTSMVAVCESFTSITTGQVLIVHLYHELCVFHSDVII